MYTEDYEQEIDLKDLLFVLLYRWRILLLAAVIGAMGMKAGAYLQPLVHRISGGKDPEPSVQAESTEQDRPGIS